MDHSKLKRFWPRTASDSEPETPRRSRRLGSDPTSRRVRLTDRWDDGFLRLPAAGRGARGLSYIVDGLGIYYDATAPSELEIMLEEGGWETPETLARAEAGSARLREERLSLDNDPRRRLLGEVLGEAPGPRAAPRVAIVDQGRRDATIGFGLAGATCFTAMLAAAAAEHPQAERVVVMDPAAPPGTVGHIDAATAARFGARLVTEPVAAWSVVEECARLFVVTSHIGLEAALAGRRVTCFGLPFYAGWGFTDDRLHLPRRSRRRSPQEVFAAAYIVCSRYFDPYLGEACRLEDALDYLALIVGRARENTARTLCLGFSAWKRRSVSETFSSPGQRPVIPQKVARVTASDLRGFARVVAWASRMPEGTEEACRAAGIPLLRMEDGFLRSVGLGVALRPGASHVLDRAGVYYDATRPSDLERLLETAEFDEAMLERAADLRETIVAARVSKYNVGGAPMPPRPRPGPLVLVAGQVENDASIRLGCLEVRTNADLLRRARERHPEAVIAFKPHPDVEAGLRPGWVPAQDLAAHADMVLRDVSAADAIDAADHVETLTSLIGFEALLRGKPVTTHGLPFYAGWGLTESPPCPRRTRRLSLDELVAGALIAYPRYVDPRTGLPCPPEVLVRRLAEGDPSLSRRELTAEAVMKQVWSLIWRHVLRRG
ncbi:Capsule polysaccharide biosynthesis protein [Methylobacterium sp. 4-46]|uniref:capsular polysaccharide biosynthesis protein n=1 Tax=unclassified Methylobacterium TaxID=2615210 RepID=UPI000165C5C9|nr:MULTISPECIES: capsular polysaccharide biosynthesis protein [Methylobacterium]ACA14892.1 Capsule polysaccharide biosynthesis protein [Methylobacterium sp. 4-46]WFT80632.1 capsular polysaccharide biosynthesis protein [Methylobacterium nodulans]